MIVFLYVIAIFALITIILLLSNIKIILKNMCIRNSNDALFIINILLKENDDIKKLNVLDYILFDLKLQIRFLNKIPIFSFNLDNYKAKKILLKQYYKEIKKNKDIEQDKKKMQEFSKKLIRKFTLEKTNFNMSIGTEDAAFTAITSSIINIAISLTLPYVADMRNLKNYHYKVSPIYLNKNVFFLQFSCIITIKLVHIINVICKKEESKKK